MLRVGSPGRVAVLGLDRPTAAERQGVEEKVTVSSQREIPVEEILRRLQAFEDAQNRRLEHYSATNTTSLRFQPAAGTQAIEATLQGPFFFDPKTGTDWAWQTLYVNGVKWRGKTLPEIPLIQPEKAAAAAARDPLHQGVPLPPARLATPSTAATPGWSTSPRPARTQPASSTRARSGSTSSSTPGCAPAPCRWGSKGRCSRTRRRSTTPPSTPPASPPRGRRRATCCRCGWSPSRSSRWSTPPRSWSARPA